MKTDNKHYALAWIDILVSQYLHPDKNNLHHLSAEQLKAICTQIKTQTYEWYTTLCNQCYSRPGKKEQIIQQYYLALISILQQVDEYKKHTLFARTEYRQVLTQADSAVRELLQMIRLRYHSYVSTVAMLTREDAQEFQKTLKVKYRQLRSKYGRAKHHALPIVFKRLDRLLKSPSLQLSQQAIQYKHGLLDELLRIVDGSEQTNCHPIDRLLIAYNYNSKEYIQSLITQFENILRLQETPDRKLNTLALLKKKFSQIQPKPNAVLNPNYYSLSEILSNWLQQEIQYYTTVSPETESLPPRPSVALHKITCHLSTDQIALILRAADESKILQARSLNEVFKTIVPYLATPRKAELSYRAVRNRIYNVEQADKEVAIGTLQQLIQKIQSY
jgi:hypothetical protein